MLASVRLNPIGRLVRFVTGFPASIKERIATVSEYLAKQETERIATNRLSDMLESAYMAEISTIRIIHNHGDRIRAVGIPNTPDDSSVTFKELDVCDFLSILNYFGLDQNPKKIGKREFELQKLTPIATVTYSLAKDFSRVILTLQLTFSSPPTDQTD